MWFRKKPELLECSGCRCLMRRGWKTVEVRRFADAAGVGCGFVYVYPPQNSTEHFCGRCAPPYDIRRVDGGETLFYNKHPSREVEVTVAGKDIKKC